MYFIITYILHSLTYPTLKMSTKLVFGVPPPPPNLDHYRASKCIQTEVFTLPHLFLLESSWNPTIPGRNTRNPGGMTRNFLPANLHSNPQFLVLPSPGGIHLESWQISSPTRIPGHLGGIIPPGILLESYHSW